jgi:hypothetical protein
MKISRRKKKLLELIPLILLAIFVSLVLFDVRTPEPEIDVPIGLAIWINEPSPSVANIDVRIALHLRCTGTLVAMKKVDLSGFGEILSPEFTNITYISVGFKTSLAYPPANDTMSGFPSVNIINLYRWGTVLLPDRTDIYFPVSGDFEAGCVVHIGNDTKSGAFDLPNIHVEPESELTTERLNRSTFLLTIGFVFFSFIELAYLYSDHVLKQDDKLGHLQPEIEKTSQELWRITEDTEYNSEKQNSKPNNNKQES